MNARKEKKERARRHISVTSSPELCFSMKEPSQEIEFSECRRVKYIEIRNEELVKLFNNLHARPERKFRAQ